MANFFERPLIALFVPSIPGTTLLFESTPTYPDPGRYWETGEGTAVHTMNFIGCESQRLFICPGWGEVSVPLIGPCCASLFTIFQKKIITEL